MNNDKMDIIIDKKTFYGWPAFSIVRTLDSCADAFSMTAILNSENSDIESAMTPFRYQDCFVNIDNDRILSGTLEQFTASISESEKSINIQGRSFTGILIDCSIYNIGYQFDGLKISEIAKTLCSPFGISVIVNDDSAVIAEARATPGQTVYEFLNQLASDNGLLLSNDARGNLVIGKYEKGKSVDTIIEGESRLISASGTYDSTNRFSIYQVLQQQDGNNDISEIAEDENIIKYRPKVISGSSGNSENIEETAKWARALGLAKNVNIEIGLSGWRTTSGKLWDPGDTVILKSPGALIKKESEFIISRVSLKCDVSSGKTTDLTLVLPETFSGELPRIFPWA